MKVLTKKIKDLRKGPFALGALPIFYTILFCILAIFVNLAKADSLFPYPYDANKDYDIDGTDLFYLANSWNVGSSDSYLERFSSKFGCEWCFIQFDFTNVPAYGDDHDLFGVVRGVRPCDYRIAVYIKVGDLWWTKPYFDRPFTLIMDDGTWSCDITTGGCDQFAFEVAAFLLPVESVPKLSAGSTKLPEYTEAVAFIRSVRYAFKTLSFAGYNWKIKRADCPCGPGPNYFSDDPEHVWVDDQGLHLTIKNRDGSWYCTEVILDSSLGYGTYVFQTKGRVDILDPMVVLGIFTWDMSASNVNYREMDIEFARWGDPNEFTNTQYVVQPCNVCPGCGDNCIRFRIDLTEENDILTHYLIWQPGLVEFRTYAGDFSDTPSSVDALIKSWIHTGEDVPVPGEENIRFNLWLFEGDPPDNLQDVHVIIKDFAYRR